MNIDISEPARNPEITPYDLIGGERAVHALVTHFYDEMDANPDYYGIRKLHPGSLEQSREKLFLFLCGWLGGPQRYVEAFGHPRLRARHLPFPIGLSERDQWLACMQSAMEQSVVEPTLRARLMASFASTADWMRNREG